MQPLTFHTVATVIALLGECALVTIITAHTVASLRSTTRKKDHS